MNITLSADRRLLEKARKVAWSMGLSLNELVRRHLRQVTAESDPEADFQELKKLLTEQGGHSGGRRFDRDEIHDRAGLSGHQHTRLR